jgi:hypothetical protein
MTSTYDLHALREDYYFREFARCLGLHLERTAPEVLDGLRAIERARQQAGVMGMPEGARTGDERAD